MGTTLMRGVNDLATTHPDLAREWHPTKNGDLTPEDVSAGSNSSYWWLCIHAHDWLARAAHRRAGSGCPYCAGQKVWPGYNDLATTRPDLAREWHPSKNGDHTPSQTTASSGRKAWWTCPRLHAWEATPANRTIGQGCPYCSNRAVLEGFNDLATTHPDLAREWHPTKNGDLTPSTVIAGTGRPSWWRCRAGHTWRASGAVRLAGKGCPYCAGQKVWSGFNDLATTHPDLAREWDPSKNGTLRPTDVTAGSGLTAWWTCDFRHTWKSSVTNRRKGQGCPYCSNRAVLVGFNDLATTHPDLAREWHPTKNGTLRPTDVTSGSDRSAWWSCPEGHSWRSRCANRAIGQGCPTCAKTGFDPSKSALLYFLTSSEYRARKVGITNIGTKRLADFARSGWTPVHIVENPSGAVVAAVERAFFLWLRREQSLPVHLGRSEMRKTGGWTETFSMEGPSDAEVIARIDSEFASRDPDRE